MSGVYQEYLAECVNVHWKHHSGLPWVFNDSDQRRLGSVCGNRITLGQITSLFNAIGTSKLFQRLVQYMGAEDILVR